ncbi:MAG: acyl-ACP--UDP-N-acetylglucosamine O-acyltransferase [Rhodospirillaceae bacterium]|nr:acyl-ACP--UDP-N-acetylglucosamine O-acyltransferase [Rhodospirillaceae bacterium]
MAHIHPTSVIDAKASLADDVEIGPFCVVGPGVVLHSGVRLISHVTVVGLTEIGEKTEIYPFASIGLRPQDLKYHGEPSRLVIGCRNQIREGVTMNPGTEGGGMLTQVGDNGLFMVGAHVAHDCIVGDNCIFANNATLGGHVEVGDFAIIGGISAVHQFVRIGQHAMIGGASALENDVIPYGSVLGNRAHLCGLNIVGLKRRNFGRETIHTLRRAYRLLFAQEGNMTERVEDVAGLFSDCEPVMEIVTFMRQNTSRGICQPGALDKDA